MSRAPAFAKAVVTLGLALTVGGAAQAQVKPLKPLTPSPVRPELRKLNLQPDLVIRSLRLKSYGPCKPRHAVLTFEAVVANIGDAPAPALKGAALVKVAEKNGAGPWAGGAVHARTIPPGGSVRVSVPVYYLQSIPRHMVTGAPHRFRALADPLERISEKNESNNRSAAIRVAAPPACPSADKTPEPKLNRPLSRNRDLRRLPGAPDRFKLVRPDLVVGAVHVAQSCEISKVALRLFNIGNGGVPESAWDRTRGSVIRILLDGAPWGTLRLADADPEKLLRRPRSRTRGHEVTLPVRRLQLGTHRIAVTADSNETVAERNERNNTRVETIYCRVEPDADALSSGK